MKPAPRISIICYSNACCYTAKVVEKIKTIHRFI